MVVCDILWLRQKALILLTHVCNNRKEFLPTEEILAVFPVFFVTCFSMCIYSIFYSISLRRHTTIHHHLPGQTIGEQSIGHNDKINDV